MAEEIILESSENTQEVFGLNEANKAKFDSEEFKFINVSDGRIVDGKLNIVFIKQYIKPKGTFEQVCEAIKKAHLDIKNLNISLSKFKRSK